MNTAPLTGHASELSSDALPDRIGMLVSTARTTARQKDKARDARQVS